MWGILLRIIAGTLGSTLAGWALFGSKVFQFGNPASQCIFMGTMASAIFALLRAERAVQALWFVGAFGMLQIGLTWSSGPIRCAATVGWSLFIGIGFVTAGLVFDRLARFHFRLGKFLVAGPLVGGIYFAATPLASFAIGRTDQVVIALWDNAMLGIAIGDGVGLGIEILELLGWLVALLGSRRGDLTARAGATAAPAGQRKDMTGRPGS